VVLGGTLLPIDRIAADRPYCSGKHREHGVNVQVLFDPTGRLVLGSPILLGASHDLIAARVHGLIEASDQRRRRLLSGQGLPRRRWRHPRAVPR
jgi:hypothetical protein